MAVPKGGIVVKGVAQCGTLKYEKWDSVQCGKGYAQYVSVDTTAKLCPCLCGAKDGQQCFVRRGGIPLEGGQERGGQSAAAWVRSKALLQI